MRIRKIKKQDVETILKIGLSTEEFRIKKETSLFWSEKQLLRWIDSKNDVMLIAEDDDKIIGFIFMAHHVPTGKVTWENAWVDPKQRGQNIVGKLYKEAEKELKRKGATYICSMTKPTSKSSIRMQEKLGFDEGLKFIWMGKFI
jgi:ribosomal protein S18 acetylase RimI-like enzyme